MIKLAIDAMGGDFAPEQIIKGVNLAIKENSDLELVVFGDKKQIDKYLVASNRVTIVQADTKLDMGVHNPVMAIRKDKELSLSKAFKSVKEGECLGAVTAGPTQGVVVAAHMIIKKIPGMSRIALCPIIPNMGGKERMLLDVGANVELKPEHILQIATFANIYAKEVRGIEKPIIGLLNIGSEEGKGREVDREAYDLLNKDEDINFYGNIEPKEMLASDCDIIVSDGFSGNLVMKTIEGTAKAIGSVLKEEIKKSLRGKIGYLFMKKNLNNFKKRLNADDVGGALIFGVNGVVVKAHGNSNAYAFSRAIQMCYKATKSGFLSKMKDKLVVNENS